MVVVIRKTGILSYGFVKRVIAQGPVLKMGSSFSRSYSPNSGQNKDKDVCGKRTISRMDSNIQYVESVVCNEGDLKDNEMKVFDIGEDGKVLLVKQKGEFSALGTKCTHYGAPLVSGALGDGRIRCQWHGACFNIKTGDIEDFPGFDSLPCYQVTVTEKGQVKVRAKVSDLQTNKRIKDIGAVRPCESTSVVIVGGGPSGATCAETLRSEGFNGRITVVAKEPYLPYDRIKVSKIGVVTDIKTLQARTDEYYDNANIEIIKGVEATKVDPENRFVYLNDSTKLKYSALYLATGCKPRVPDVPGIDLENVFTVRNYEDAISILTKLGDKNDKDVVVLGLSFIGLESAASCSSKARSVTVVGKDTAPLGQIFGHEIGRSLQKLFEDKGIRFEFDTTIAKCNGENGVLKSVVLTNECTLAADILILGVGTTFYTDFLGDSGIELQPNGAVTVNDKLETNIKNVYAGGDIAYAPVFAHGNKQMSIGHVGLAQYHGRVAALNILRKDTPLRTVPYFWTMLFGKSIRYAGCGKSANILVDGDVDALKFVVFFFDESDKVIAVASCMRDPVVSQFAELLYQGKSLYKKDLKDDMFGWTKTIN
ncbi:apoptosis-inducing factor 3 isoform X2 [Amyelois transitella]|uniref:apoptosis-inducing factor 3 isoform X2 n=1 Tax=Amyelois transitella TaxID=680683 RepID=UPI00067DCCFF|nr:apoptosis-inducing factor 3 isoform X2 [Amyelois transitella]